MTIDVNVMFQILGLFGTVIGVIWYVSNMINSFKTDISKSDQINEQQEKKLESLENMIQTNYKTERDGRIKIWEDLNALKLKVAQLEGKHEK